MLKAYITHGAVAAKVRAMYGRLLDGGELAEIMKLKTVADIAGYLSSRSDYAGAISTCSPEDGAQGIISALRDVVADEYARLYAFIPAADRKLLQPAVYQVEYHSILSAVGRLSAGGGAVYKAYAYKEPMAAKSAADILAIECCEDFGALLSAAGPTIYHTDLLSLQLNENGLPSYVQASLLLENRYYRAVYSWLLKQGKDLAGKLVELVGLEADLVNINGILRLHRHFPASLPALRDSLLIPVRGRLTDELIEKLSGARDEEEAVRLLGDTCWAKYYPAGASHDLEYLHERAMENFCRRLIAKSGPAPWFPKAYLALREIECARLVRIIEAVGYGMDPRAALGHPNNSAE